MIPAAFLLVLSLLLVIRPQVFVAPSDRARAQRLEQIRAGDPERFFEEERALTGYRWSSRFLLLWRVLGGVGVAACLFLMTDLSGLLAG